MRFFYTLACVFAALTWNVPASAQSLPAGQWVDIPDTHFRGAERTQMSLGQIACTADPTCSAIVDPDQRMQAASALGAKWCSELDGCPGGHFSWTGSAYDSAARRILHLRQEGHHDGRGADSQCIDLSSLWQPLPPERSTWWYECEPSKHMTLETGQTKLINGVATPICNFPPDGGASMHGYDGLAALGEDYYLVLGNDPGCKSDVSKPSKLAYLVDADTVVDGSFKWTRVPQIDAYSGQTATAVYQGKLYVLEVGGKWIVLDIAELIAGHFPAADKGHGKLKVITGKTGFTALNSSQGSADINDHGIFAVSNQNGIALMDVSDFGWNVKHALPTGLVGNLTAVAAVPNGCFAFWNGNKDLFILKPDFLVPANDVWMHYAPAVGPTRQNSYTLSRLFYDGTLGALIGYSNRDEDMWAFKVPAGVCT